MNLQRPRSLAARVTLLATLAVGVAVAVVAVAAFFTVRHQMQVNFDKSLLTRASAAARSQVLSVLTAQRVPSWTLGAADVEIGFVDAHGNSLTMDRGRFAFQRLLVVVQVSISLVLVAGAFLFVSSFRRLLSLDPGFRADGVLEASFDLGRQDHDEATLGQLLAEVRATPEVESAAATTNFLIGSGMWSLIARSAAAARDVRFTWVSPGFFATLNTPILSGRDFSPRDARTSRKVVLVNENFARLFFPGSNPLGKIFRTLPEPDYPETEYEIVGLVRNCR